MHWGEREGVELRSRLRGALEVEFRNPGDTLSLYADLERDNHLTAWPMTLLALISVGGASAVMFIVVDRGLEPVVPISFLVTFSAMCVPVFACLSRESRVLGAGLGFGALARRTLVGGSQVLLLDGLLLFFVCFLMIVVVSPLQLFVLAVAHLNGVAWFPPMESEPWVYLPWFAAVAFAFLCWLWNVEMEHFPDRFFIFPHKTAGQLAAAISHQPAEGASALLFGGSALVVGTTLEVPYEGFAACFPAVLLIFRDGLPGRDPELSHLIRVGQIRTALRLGKPGARHGFWYRSQATWYHERLGTELHRERWLMQPNPHRDASDVDDVEEKAEPLGDLAFGVSPNYVEQAVAAEEREINWLREQLATQSRSRDTYGREWLLSTENTLELLRAWPETN